MELEVKFCDSNSTSQEGLPTIPDSFSRPRNRTVWRPTASDIPVCSTFRRSSYGLEKKSRSFSDRSKRLVIHRRGLMGQASWSVRPVVGTWVEYPNFFLHPADQPSPNIHKAMTTIKEESKEFIPKSSFRSSAIKKPRDIEEKVAALHVIVNRLHKLCLEKPEALEGTIPDETIQQFKEIRL